MPWLEQRSGSFLVSFRWQGKKYRQKIAARTQREADAALARVEDTLSDIDRGRLVVPPDADIATYLLSDGKLAEKPSTAAAPSNVLTLAGLAEQYLTTFANGSREPSTLLTARIHLNHIRKTLGDDFAVEGLSLANLQRHVDRRAMIKTHRGKPVSAYTIHKEVKTLRAAWNWAAEMGLVDGVFPVLKKLALPRQDEKPAFQTLEEINRQVARGGLSTAEEAELWRNLYLSRAEIAALLEHVRQNSRVPFLYPMVATACHTGARRSELCRVRVDDVDRATNTIVLREKKRVEGKNSTRRVPMSAFLIGVLIDWLVRHPGGQYLFAIAPGLSHSGKARPQATPITTDEAHNHVRRTLSGSVWTNARWHTFRHSFVSNCAAAGVDQRVISEWVGHQTVEQERRYRHLFPDLQRKAIDSVFTSN
jgi:integrase